jgi:diguanylate cyclase (GGDEF)-like protein/PAS domain S-box-containing protein
MFLSRAGTFEPDFGRRSGRSRLRLLRNNSEVQPAAVIESLDLAVIGRGRDGLIQTWNGGAERLYGYAAAEVVGQSFELLVPAKGRRSEADVAGACLLAGLSDSFQTTRLHRSGSETAVQMLIAPVRGSAGDIVGISTIEHEVAEASLEDRETPGSEAVLRSAFEDAPIGMALISIEPPFAGHLIRVNRALCALTGYPSHKLEGSDLRVLLHPDDEATDLAAVERLNAGEIEHFQIEQRLLHRERHAVWVTSSASLVRDADRKPLYCIRQVQDIEERKRYEGELGFLVEHDPLTGLLNRRGFVRELAHEMAYARRYGGGGSVLLLDLDDFKSVNDTLGHDAGDEVLSEVSRIVGGRLRETDSFARLGGDEFAVLLPHTAAEDAQAIAKGLLEAVRDGCAVSFGDGRTVSVSIGINGFQEPSEESTAEDILLDADDAMYTAKEAGKDRVALSSAATHDRTRARVTWAERVRRAVQNGLFELYCQPIVDFTSDIVSQWELLLRLPGEGDELILPAQFLYTAERSGLILDVDQWVVGEAMRLIAEHNAAGRELRLEVNISGRSVGDPALLALVESRLRETKIDPANLVLEVTETAAIANMDRARGFATVLQSLGCRFALDDFGAGFGSFYYLKHIPFDYVKIDGEFIRNLPASSTDQLILDSIVQMSTGLKKHTIAEFVGDQETVEVLKEHGVHYGQGFHLGRPRPVTEALVA